MRQLILSVFLVFTISINAQVWVKTKATIIEIIPHKRQDQALLKFKLENGKEQITSVVIVRLPFWGNINSVGDEITIRYDKEKPTFAETKSGSFVADYGMYILIFLGIILSIKPFLKLKGNES